MLAAAFDHTGLPCDEDGARFKALCIYWWRLGVRVGSTAWRHEHTSMAKVPLWWRHRCGPRSLMRLRLTA